MKAFSGILLICLIFSATAAGTDLKSQLSSLMAMTAQAGDAVDDALDLLRSFVQQEHDEQTAHDESHAHELEVGHALIAALTGIRDEIQGQCDAGQKHVDFINQEIRDTSDHLAWIENRLATLARQRQELADARCASNAVFVQTLREHKDALEIIAWLRGELQNWHNAHNAEFVQVNNVADKLKLYSHLFNKNELNEFLQLGEPQTWDQLTDSKTHREWDDAHVDNDQAALTLEDPSLANRDLKGTIVGRISALLDKLEAHLHASLKNLEDNEIKAAYDLGEWLDHAEQEERENIADRDRKTEYLAKLEVDLVSAQDEVVRCHERLDAAQASLDAAIADLNAKIDWYNSETARRTAEIDLLGEIIAIFEERVSSMKDYLRNRVGGGDFDNTLAGHEI